jgi:Protein of unknown function (DUF3575)
MKKIVFASVLLISVGQAASAQRMDKVRGLGYSGELFSNIAKVNISPISIGVVSLQYEKFLKRKNSVLFAMSMMPKRSLPGASSFATTPGDFATIYSNTRISTFAITPEYRHYFGKQVGRGVYLGGLLRYQHYKIKTPTTFLLADNSDFNIDLSGKMSRIGAGLQLGAQASLGKRFVLDFWLLGPTAYRDNLYFGAKSVDFNLLATELEDFKKAFEGLDQFSPILGKIGITATNQELSIQNAKFGYGTRAGLCIGYKFL